MRGKYGGHKYVSDNNQKEESIEILNENLYSLIEAIKNYASYFSSDEEKRYLERHNELLTTKSIDLTKKNISKDALNQQKVKKKNEVNQVWQKSLEDMADEIMKSGKSRPTKERLTKNLAKEIMVESATIARNTRKTW